MMKVAYASFDASTATANSSASQQLDLYPDIPFPRVNPVRRAGQPRHNWAEMALEHIWDEAHDPGQPFSFRPYRIFEVDSEVHIQDLNMLAHLRLI